MANCRASSDMKQSATSLQQPPLESHKTSCCKDVTVAERLKT